MKTYIFKYTVLLFFGQVSSWLLLFYSPLNIPIYIPETPINISGLSLLILLVIILYYFQKELLKLNDSYTTIQLTILGTLVSFASELMFQIIRFPTIEADTITEKLYYACRGAAVIPLFALAISLIIAVKLKRKIYHQKR